MILVDWFPTGGKKQNTGFKSGKSPFTLSFRRTSLRREPAIRQYQAVGKTVCVPMKVPVRGPWGLATQDSRNELDVGVKVPSLQTRPVAKGTPQVTKTLWLDWNFSIAEGNSSQPSVRQAIGRKVFLEVLDSELRRCSK